MSGEENKANVRRVFEEGWNQGNTAVFDELFAADYLGHDPSGPIHGPEGFKQYYATYRAAFPDRISITRIANGKAVEDWVNFDTLGMLQQIGAIPTPG